MDPPRHPSPHNRWHMTRRHVLFASAASLALFAAGGGFAQPAPLALIDHPCEFFQPAEWRFVLAACDRLIPETGEGPGALAARVPVFIDRDLAGPFGWGADWYMQGPHDAAAEPEFGWQSPLGPAEVYRRAIPLIDAHARANHGRPFANLASNAQDKLLIALEKGDLDLPAEVSGFWDLLLAQVKQGYFADPIYGGNHDMAAWVYIGFPGARANFLEWVPRHNERYPLGPVSISGDRR